MNIKILDKKTAEQIAAGEVIENPASVVKELVENALDAGSTRIDVEICAGGKDSIIVTDNGKGIPSEEIALAFKRFATSKLSVIDDLNTIASLGFRGEALPSIAAVSRIMLITRTKEALSGSLIKLSGGEIVKQEEVGAPFGTRVEITDLFYNTPGRLKFLRAAAAETARISSLLSELALAYPKVAFNLISGGKKLFSSSGDNNLLHVIGSIYGNSTAESMVELIRHDKSAGFTLNGFVSAPHHSRSSRRWITVVINGRLVKNPMIVNALERGYGDYLPRQRYPLAIIKLSVPQNSIDVNVHPAKVEIRFENPEAAKSFVYETVRKALHNIKSFPKSKQDQGQIDYDKRTPEIEPVNLKISLNKNRDIGFMPVQEHFSSYYTEPAVSAVLAEELIDKDLRLIGQYLNSYLVVQKEDDLVLIDQHAAHERVIYQQLLDKASAAETEQHAQLTIPLPLELPLAWRGKMSSILPLLENNGFNIDQLGEDSYVVRSVPFIYERDTDSSKLLQDLLEKIFKALEEENEDEQDIVLKTIACHKSVKAGQPLTREEMERLLSDWLKTARAFYCPHGRPTVVSLNRSMLEKCFNRKGV